MTQSFPWSTAASTASASRPVGVRLCETCNAAAAIPAPVRASVTCAVAGFGDPAASLPSASVTVFLTVSVAAAAAADDVPDVSASGPAVPVSVDPGAAAAGASADVAPVAGPDGPGCAPGDVPLTHPAKPAASAAAAMAAVNRRAALGRPTALVVAARLTAAGLADEAPAVEFCRWSGVSRMSAILPCPQVPASCWDLRDPGRQGAAGGVPRPRPPRNQGGRQAGFLSLGTR